VVGAPRFELGTPSPPGGCGSLIAKDNSANGGICRPPTVNDLAVILQTTAGPPPERPSISSPSWERTASAISRRAWPRPSGIPQDQPRPAPAPQAGPVYRGGDNGNTVAGLVSSRLPEELAGPKINEIAARAGVDPNEPLTDPIKRQRVIQTAQLVLGGQPAAPQPSAGRR